MSSFPAVAAAVSCDEGLFPFVVLASSPFVPEAAEAVVSSIFVSVAVELDAAAAPAGSSSSGPPISISAA